MNCHRCSTPFERDDFDGFDPLYKFASNANDQQRTVLDQYKPVCLRCAKPGSVPIHLQQQVTAVLGTLDGFLEDGPPPPDLPVYGPADYDNFPE
ncbi:MAG: hypothetical protein AB7Q01_08615 [Gammaproteobacteria bacterium]